jgi:hypothetical protein
MNRTVLNGMNDEEFRKEIDLRLKEDITIHKVNWSKHWYFWSRRVQLENRRWRSNGQTLSKEA